MTNLEQRYGKALSQWCDLKSEAFQLQCDDSAALNGGLELAFKKLRQADQIRAEIERDAAVAGIDIGPLKEIFYPELRK